MQKQGKRKKITFWRASAVHSTQTLLKVCIKFKSILFVFKIFDIINSKLEYNPSICTDSFDALLHYPTQVTCKRDRFYAKYSFWPSNLQPIYHHHSDKTWHEIDPIFETRYLVYTICNNKWLLFCIVKHNFGQLFWTDLIVEHLLS